MRITLLLFLIPVLAFSQLKDRKFKLPTGARSGQYASTHVLVKVKKDHQHLFDNPTDVTSLKNLSKSVKPVVSKSLQIKNKNRMAPRLTKSPVDVSRLYEIGFDGGNIENFINRLYATGYFELVEPDYTAQLHYSPNDPQKGSQYYLDKIRAYEAWDITKGSENIIIGIVDSGGDLDHPDLASQLYTNTNDPVDGIDNDNDGYIDNNRGWDFMGSDTLNINNPDFLGDNDPNNPNGGLGSHGSAVAGCAAAATDNSTGIAGVGFRSKILFTKHSADNQGATKGGIYRGYSGILYAASQGAKIINCSWGGEFRSQIQQDLITYVTLELGSLVVASAGNLNSSKESYPASYDYVLSVAASDANDVRASFSNYGTTVDIIAPGRNIFTTFFNNTFTSVDGTSFSAPITAGAAALVLALNPGFSPIQVAEQLRVTADESIYTNNQGFIAKLGKGRLDVARALTAAFPSIRATNPKLVNSSGSVAEPGQDAFLYMDFTNYLSSTSAGLTIEITPLLGVPVTMTKGIIQPGLIAMNATINNKLNPFELKINNTVPTNTQANFLITYSDGAYSDYQYLSFIINPSFLDVDENQILTTLASNGRIGFENPSEQTNGVGFNFNDNKLLYEMGLIMGNASTKLFNNVRGVSSSFDQDFLVTQKIKKITPGERSFSEIFGTITDNAASKTVSIKYRSLVWKEKPYDQFVILEYKVKNISTEPLNNFHFALFADWDITDQGGGDVAKWDASNNLGYVHPAQSDDKPYAGIKILNGISPEYFAIDNNQSTAGAPFGLYDGFTDAEKFQTISSGIGRTNAGQTTSSGNDVSHVVGAGPYSLAADQEITITFALVAGVNFAELKYAAAQADTAYNFMLTVNKPSVAQVAVCYGAPATLTATGASKFNWYKDFTGGEPFFSGNTFTTNNLFSDTVFYVSNADNSYESVRTAARVVVEGNPKIIASGSGTICNGTTIILSVAEADEYLWSNGAVTKSIGVTVAGNYFVNVKENTLGCNTNSEMFEVKVNPKPISDFIVEGELHPLIPISFENLSSGANSYAWNFGDGQTSTAENPSHTFSTMNDYEVTLTVSNAFGCTHTSAQTISVITGLGTDPRIHLYPNPMTGSLIIQTSWEKLEYTISDLVGRVYRSSQWSLDNNQVINVEDLPTGIYFITLSNGNEVVTRKLIKK